jgi:hypothetical protein
MPFSYANALPQLEHGASLRFVLPAIAAGAIVLAPVARRAPIVTAIVACVSAIAAFIQLIVTFSNDAVTIGAFASGAVVVALALLSIRHRIAGFAATTLAAALLLAGSQSARARAASFYAGEMPKINGAPTPFFDWFHAHPHAAQVIDIRAGELLVLAPSAQIADADSVQCRNARRQDAWIVVGTDPDVPNALRQTRMRQALRCGRTIFNDGDVVVAAP